MVVMLALAVVLKPVVLLALVVTAYKRAEIAQPFKTLL